jgi:hypothetical protein
MSIDINVYLNGKPDQRLDTIIGLLTTLLAKENTIMKELDDLATQVAQNTEVEASAVQLIQNIADKLAAAGTDPVKLAALKEQLTNSASALAAAVAANTVAAG